MAAQTRQEQQYEERKAKIQRHAHGEFFDLPVDALTDDERRARWPYAEITRD